ncbi:MAG: tetratricopeptide repeat protein [Treponema sp.]|uniref:tetratricopeptide repeat protein n=1 Tax=Treponema sp. TaxID=166 RepID=UPI0025F9D863|nr:tetratricopeptide repeat protein [Treponema sp.]MBQ9283217.1 tetratricopeptide repeat protein [Treponema sp.]
MKKILFLIPLICIFSFRLSAVDFALRISSGSAFPDNEKLGSGYGGMVNADIDLFNFCVVGVEGGYKAIRQKSLDENFNIFMGGVSGGVYYFPLSRMYVSANASFGFHDISINSPGVTDSGSGLYWRTFCEMGFRFTPSFILSGLAGYESFYLDSSKFISSYFAGLSLKFNFSSRGKSSSDSFAMEFNQDFPTFPVYSALYKQSPIGYAFIQNESSAEMQDVYVSFRAGKYTTTERESFEIPILRRHRGETVPVYADFSPEILRYGEDGKVIGELVLTYRFLGKAMTEIKPLILDVKHRNAFSWNDSEFNIDSLVCFISSTTPEILEAAKYIAGVETNNLKTGMNSPFQYAAAIMEGLRLSGIVYSEDKLTPYSHYRLSEDTDSIQYPLQTLSLLGGDYDDLGILVCSCLESFGIATGFVALDDDFIVLVDTEIAPEKKSNNFGEDSVLSDENTTWLALAMSQFDRGFTKARLSAGEKLSRIQKKLSVGQAFPYKIVSVHSAWKEFPPVSFSGYKGSYKNPPKNDVLKAVDDAISFYINNDLAELITRFKASGDTKLLADTYVRSGRYDEALSEYKKLNTTAAWNNMGLVYSAQKNYKAALEMYQKVLEKDKDNPTALSNIRKIQILIGD